MSDTELIALTLTPDNPCNTTITDANGRPVYVVHTNTGARRSTTTVYDANEGVVAECTWGLDDATGKVTWRNGKEMPMSKWMRKGYMPFASDVSFTDETGRKYKWKGNEPGIGVSLKLYTIDDGYREPIAGFKKSLFLSESSDARPRWTPARLLLTTRALEIRDLAVASFLFLERGVRTSYQGTKIVVTCPLDS